jgi:protein TonB
VPYVRIVIDRQGKVPSTQLDHPSGFPDLDREAVALPGRARCPSRPTTNRATR